MGTEGFADFTGKIKDLKKWLEQFNDDDVIEFIGGSDSGWEFLEIKVNNKTVYST